MASSRSFCPCRAGLSSHYRWHAYFDAEVKVFRTLNRGVGQYVSLERDPGTAILAPASILDASVRM